MQVKLALRNIRRSLRDYTIYFVTLVFAVAMFYAFNSVQSQSILFDIEEGASANMFELTGEMLGLFSVVIAIILGFLVIYANRFLIKRRKQEFGTYLMLGMRPGAVSSIVLIETFTVGLASLCIGLMLGYALSQGLSFATAALFEMEMDHYQFVFSLEAFITTLVCFASIYLVVALFNTLTIRRYKLIDLMNANRTNERMRFRNPKVTSVTFALSLVMIAAAYHQLIETGITEIDAQFLLSTALMVAGTVLFFYSVSGFVLAVIGRSDSFYLKKIRAFTARQIASKLNIASIAMAVVCVLLFFSITVFSVGMGMVDAFTGNANLLSLYDNTLDARPAAVLEGIEDSRTSEEGKAKSYAIYDEMQAYDGDMAQRLSERSDTWDEVVAASAQIDIYEVDDVTYRQLFERVGEPLPAADDEDLAFLDSGIQVVALSQFNATRALVGEEPIGLDEGQYAVNCTLELAESMAMKLAASEDALTLNGFTLESASAKPCRQPLCNAMFAGDLEVIVPDAVVEARGDALPYISTLNIMYATDRQLGDRLFSEALAEACPPSDQTSQHGGVYESALWPVLMSFSGQEVVMQMGGMRMLISYLALYVGFILLIATAAILAIQQLSETNDSIDRYRTLSQLGCDDALIRGSLRTQTMAYFLAPLALAGCHSACAIGVVSRTIFQSLGISVLGPTLLAVAVVVLVYGSYLAVTYGASRAIVQGALARGRR